jgi:exodeoxyribonuclease III
VRIATWNVNSIRARHDLVLDWTSRHAPDVLCLQETKVTDDEFPVNAFQRLGYSVAMAGQRSYNGVAILSRQPMTDVRIGLIDDPPDAPKRLIGATIGDVRVFSAYVPNGQVVDSPPFVEKLRWLERLRALLDARHDSGENLVLCGDFNVARDERDVFSPERFAGKLHFSLEERRALEHVIGFGLVDVFRRHHDQRGHFTWWDYRAGAFRLNQGLRIDYAFLTPPLAQRSTSVTIDVDTRRREKPSDHVPVVVELEY